MLRTGLFDVVAQPARPSYAEPRRRPAAPSIETFEKIMADRGIVARLHAGRGGRRPGRRRDPQPARSGSCPPSERSDEQITRPGRSRCSTRTNPTYIRDLGSLTDDDAATATSSSRRDCHAGLPERASTATGSTPSTATRSTSTSPTAPGMLELAARRHPQRGVRRGVGARERGGPARRLGRGPARQGARRRRRGRRGDLPRRRRGHRRRVGAVRCRPRRRAATRRPTC